jgi:DNA replication protein DnaC
MQKNDLPSLFKKILSVDLFILDDWGTVALNQKVTEEVFDLLDRRIRNVAMILTSNRLIEEWPEIFADKLLASATIDRMFEDTIVEQFRGASYRLNGGEYRRKKAISN